MNPEREARTEMPEGAEPPPRGVKTMAAVRWAILAISAIVASSAWWSYATTDRSPASGSAYGARYHCPMHPQITSNEPGECVICHMSLEPIPAHRAAPAVSGTPAGAPAAPGSASVVAGTTPITLSLDRVQAIGVRTAQVAESSASEPLRVSAVVAATEGGAAEVHVRSTGFVERMLVNETGAEVRARQPLFTFYSPEIYQAESELLAVSQWAAGDGQGGASEAARRKLELLGMASRDVDQVVKTRELLRAVPVYAPQAGHVVKKNVVVGGYVTPDMVLYELQDLSRVYIIADVFQRDVRYLHKGAVGRFISARAEAPVDVRVDLVYPTVQAEARTTRVRMQLQNARSHATALRPGEYGSVELVTPARNTLTVPRDAVVDTGLATYVFVAAGEGTFTPRAVVLGGEHGDSLVVESGVSAGERVVSGATFLIDSESRLQAAARAAESAER